MLEEKKREIEGKEDSKDWVFRVRGKPGSFYVVAFRKQKRNF